MSKLNFINKKVHKTLNHEGAPAYAITDKDRLLTEVLTSLFNENKYYGDNSEKIVEDIRKVIKEDVKFAANLCIYARKEMHLRTISHVLAAELAKSIEGKEFVRRTLGQIIERPDDITEILAFYTNKYGKPIPNSMKKGIADSFTKFDEYQLAKYNRNGAVKLRDILCLVHPKAKTEEQNDMWKRLLENNLNVPITWETELSSKGNKKEVWEELIENNRLGYMAMLRNLRNIIKAEPYNIDNVYKFLADEKKVLNNKQLPFRYYSAYKVLKNEGIGTSKIYNVLERAIKISTKNIKELKGKTLIAADISGSMNSPISAKSDLICSEIAVIMMSIANYICEEAITTTFDTELYKCCFSSDNGIISNANSVKVNGGGTNITLPIKHLLKNKIFVDRIIILSDNEINQGYAQGGWYSEGTTCQELVNQYRKLINPDVWVHAIDLQGYGTQQFKGKNVNIIAGWNEKALEFIQAAETGIATMTEAISNYYF